MAKQDLWEKIKKSVVDGVSTAAEKTEEYTKLGRAKFDVLATKRKISKQFTELGGKIYEEVKDGKEKEVFDSPEIKVIIASINDLEKELDEKEEPLESLTKEDS